MAKILVIYHSQSGNTRKMAEAVAAGAGSGENTSVMLKMAGEATLEDLESCDGIAIGSPEYFGYMAGMIKDFFDRTYPMPVPTPGPGPGQAPDKKAKNSPALSGKPYVLFISAGNDGRGARDQIERICIGYRFRKVYESLIARGEVSQKMLKDCYEMGQTIAAGCDLGIY